MVREVSYIGRQDKLAVVEKLIKKEGTRQVLCIGGPGGIGKTRFLQEIRQRYASKKSRLLVADIIDFDDRTLHIPENVERQIAEKLEPEAFELYLRKLLDWRRMEVVDVSPEELEEQGTKVQEALADGFNSLSAERRIVLLLDTTDKLAGTKVFDHLTTLILKAKNALFLLAGRNAKELWTLLHSQLGEDSHYFELESLETDSSLHYLEQKQQQLHFTLHPDLAQKIILLAQGRPILIDLAAEWLSRNHPLDWLTQISLENLRTLPQEELKARQRDFETQLVRHVTQIRISMDRLMLVLARVYPLDANMIAELLDLQMDEASQLFEDAQTYVFVKLQSDGRITLHDEVRRMVREDVWPEMAQYEERQRRDSRLAINYLEREIQMLAERIKEKAGNQETSQRDGEAQAELDAFIAREALERELWALREQQLFHSVFVDTATGVKVFVEVFDEATKAYNFSFRETLLLEMQKYVHKFSSVQKYEVDSRWVKFWLDRGEYLRVVDLATEILGREDLSTEQRADMLIQKGNGAIRLVQFEQGLNDFEQAVQISTDHTLPYWLVRALNARGWAYRIQGKFERALADYRAAFRLSLQLNDRWRTALILNNMGYINAFNGNKQVALENCRAALDIWQKLGFGRGIGTIYSNLGEIYRRFDNLTEALTNYNKALDIFTQENDIEWISTARCGRASVLRLLGRLDQAQNDLDWTLTNGPRHLEPRIHYEQAKIYWAKKEFSKAREALERCESLSLRINDQNHDYRSFTDLVEILWELKEYSYWQEFKRKHEEFYERREGEEALRLRGSCFRKLGDLAICHGDYTDALEAYKKGLLLIALHEVHQFYTVGEQIRKSETRIRHCVSSDTLRQLGQDLVKFWHENEVLLSRYPEALLTFSYWQSEGESL